MQKLTKKFIQLFMLSLLFPFPGALANFTLNAIAENIYKISGPTGNTMVAVDSDGLILVDGVSAEYAEEYLAFVTNETGVYDIKALIISHWHPEVNGLNAILGPQDVEIISHDNTKQWLATTIRVRGETIIHTPVPADELPDTTFHQGTLSIPFRGSSLVLGYLVQAHTDGDIYVYYPDENILYSGPAIRSDSWSTVDETSSGFIGGLLDAYDTLSTLIDDNTLIIPASGPIMNKSQFASQDAMYKVLKADMLDLLRQSKSVAEVLEINPALGLKPEWGDPSDFLAEGFRSFYGHLRNMRHMGGRVGGRIL
jgi:cyclase